jgi:hypothetical protein
MSTFFFRFKSHLLACLVICCGFSHCLGAEMPKVIQKDGRYALLVDGRPYLILGGQINNSSSWPASLPEVWPLLEYMHANTVEAPVYWEQMEPKPGEFDFSTVDELLKQTRDHKLHLVLLWFGTWKNGKMHYAPEWIKADTQRYPRVINERGEPIDVLSANAPANLDADKKAFAALMRHLKEVDGDQHTILLVQVENESGSLGSVRDFSSLAENQFQGQVPDELAKALHKTTGTWKQVFGADANETFAAYSVARYINEVARAGKAEFPIPMYVNVWLKWPGDSVPGLNYPSGGPTYNMLDLWKATVSALDVIGPDIYTDDSGLYRFALKAYHRPDNAMWIPETGDDDIDAHYFFYALTEGAIGFSPFGMDRTGWTYKPDEGPVLHAENFALIGPMSREIARLNFEGKVKTAVEEEGEYQKELDFGDWQATVSFGFPQYAGGHKPAGTKDHHGRALVAQLSDNEFLVTGIDARIEFHLPAGTNGKHLQLLRAEEGAYENDSWKFLRLWNGDQTDFGLNFTHQGKVVRVRLGLY